MALQYAFTVEAMIHAVCGYHEYQKIYIGGRRWLKIPSTLWPWLAIDCKNLIGKTILFALAISDYDIIFFKGRIQVW